MSQQKMKVGDTGIQVRKKREIKVLAVSHSDNTCIVTKKLKDGSYDNTTNSGWISQSEVSLDKPANGKGK